MFDVPIDALYVWLGVGLVSLAAFGVVTALPNATAPDATAAARAIDSVAVGPPGSHDSHELAANRLKLGSSRIGLEGPGGKAHATFAYPVTPAIVDERLSGILVGERPEEVFESQEAFDEAVRAARETDPDWRPAPDRLDVRRISWGDVNVTLVG